MKNETFIKFVTIMLYFSNINTETKWAGHVVRMGRGEVCTGFWWGSLRESDHWGDPGVDGRILLRRNFRKWDVGV
jgi:hypothetical protein